MPVPMENPSNIKLLEEPLETVVSEDIWKKFDLDLPLDVLSYHNDRTYEENILPESYGTLTCFESREIRHHDCMWAGLCISKEHSGTLTSKKDHQVQKKVSAGRSLLIARSSATSRKTRNQSEDNQEPHQEQSLELRKQQECNLPTKRQYLNDHQIFQFPQNQYLESDGDSVRPETPQSSSESDTESECEGPIFKHEQISINEKLAECMGAIPKSVPISEITGQRISKCQETKRAKIEIQSASQCTSVNESAPSLINATRGSEIQNTFIDHCYHLNQPNTKKLDHLGVQTPSDSEEEIDVVTFEKPSRPAVLPTYPSPAEQQVFQLTVNTALKEKPASRPRGRPPLNMNRKNTLQDERSIKRGRQRPYQRKTKVSKSCSIQPILYPIKSPSYLRSSSDEEPDTDKRNLHNNMERQRRIELRNAFEDLRRLVPDIEAKEKAPKVAILRQAAKYCDRLRITDQENLSRITDMKKRQERLRGRLSFLRRSLAMTR